MFELDERLAADTHEVTRWPLCRVLLMNDGTYPWLILVPERADAVELSDLDAADRALLVEEAARAAGILKDMTGAAKVNVAALGNVVRQLHVHVVARFEGDPAWPRPVWGVAPAVPYDPPALATTLETLRRRLG